MLPAPAPAPPPALTRSPGPEHDTEDSASSQTPANSDLAGTTWASRSGADTIPTRAPRPKIPDALKAQYNAAQQVRREANELLNNELHEFAKQQDELLVELAKRHNKKPEKLRAILTHSPSFKKKHAPTLQNALLHAKAMEVNSGESSKTLSCYY